ncbi:MAG: aminopeptidase P N-terminal domain-containing protein [Candidatus Riflebacteria bacterium]|nr:aminopeptidase P N-terminal domain-containing protein [Candidatus Riflebacteria bacterium]
MELFRKRRARFLEALGDGVAIFATAPQRVRSNDVHYEYRPDTDFYYLTGFAEPDALAVLDPRDGERPFTLVVRPRDWNKEVWSGRRAGVEGAVSSYGADRAEPVEKLAEVITRAVTNVDRLHYKLGRYPAIDSMVLGAIRDVGAKSRDGLWAPAAIVDPGAIMQEMRLIKTADDLDLFRRAAAISVQGHLAAMRATRPGLFEYEVEAVLEFVFHKLGSPAPGFASIVASGPNACYLHHWRNDRRIGDGELLLVDAGAEWECFSGDITRTYPANRRFTGPQATIYQLVLDAQLAAISRIRPGAVFQEVHDAAVEVLTEGLVRLGFIEGPVREAIESDRYKRFYMHKTSHWLGMDVHETCSYRVKGEWRTLQEGMLFTVGHGDRPRGDHGGGAEDHRGPGASGGAPGDARRAGGPVMAGVDTGGAPAARQREPPGQDPGG